MYASISEAWGSDSLETRTQPPTQQTAVAVTRNAPNETWQGTSGLAVPTLTDAQRFQQVRYYVQQLAKQRGTRGVAKLLGPRLCRRVRNMYLLRLSTDDILHLALAGLVVALVYRLATK